MRENLSAEPAQLLAVSDGLSDSAVLALLDVQRMTVSLCSTFPRNRRTRRRVRYRSSQPTGDTRDCAR